MNTKKVTGRYAEEVEMRDYYMLNGKEYDTLVDVLQLMQPSDTAETWRTIYWPSWDQAVKLNDRSYMSIWTTYAASSLVDMGLTFSTGTADIINELPLAHLYQGTLSQVIYPPNGW